jgi:hypothetical protein
MDDEKLLHLGRPAIYIVAMDIFRFTNLYYQLPDRYPGLVHRIVRGKKSQTVTACFDETAAALQFPYYFGENWPAFDECLSDLEWMRGSAYLVMISDATEFLASAEPEDFRIWVQTILNANVGWLTPNEYIPRERKPTPFHVLFQCTSSNLAEFSRRLTEAGGEFEILQLSVAGNDG